MPRFGPAVEGWSTIFHVPVWSRALSSFCIACFQQSNLIASTYDVGSILYTRENAHCEWDANGLLWEMKLDKWYLLLEELMSEVGDALQIKSGK